MRVAQHGTRSMYNEGCREDDCRAANTLYRREHNTGKRGWNGRYKPSNLRTMTEPEAAWIGAMVEAEGSVYNTLGTDRWKVQFVNTDLELISAFLRVTGVGQVYYRESRPCTGAASGSMSKPLFIWVINAHNDVAQLQERCEMYSGKLQRIGAQ